MLSADRYAAEEFAALRLLSVLNARWAWEKLILFGVQSGAWRFVAVREAVREAARYARGLVSVECADDEGRW